MMKKIYILLSLALAAALAQGCGKKPDPRFATPEKTAAAVSRAVWENNYNDFAACLSRADRKMANPNSFRDLVAAWSSKYEIVEGPTMLGDEALLRIKTYYNEGRDPNNIGYKILDTRFILEGGNWKLELSKSDSMPFTRDVEGGGEE
jgi:hypothetical protein